MFENNHVFLTNKSENATNCTTVRSKEIAFCWQWAAPRIIEGLQEHAAYSSMRLATRDGRPFQSVVSQQDTIRFRIHSECAQVESRDRYWRKADPVFELI